MHQPKILITEDHPLAQQALVAALRSLGHTEIHTAANREEAIALVEQEAEFDILICTLSVPHVPELTLLRQLKKHGHLHALILISETPADLDAAIRKMIEECGYALLEQLRKPFAKHELHTALSRYAATLSARREKTVADTLPAKAVSKAVWKNQFIPFFQPKVNIQTMEVVGAEILMRWNHPNLGILGPNMFIDIAKRFGHLDDMTLDVLQQALSFIKASDVGEDFRLAVNIDAAQMCKADFHLKIAALLKAEKFRAKNLILEITECGIIKSPIECMANLIYLRLLGCGISIDDFGVGLSSLQRICDLPCTEVKLDMSFTKSLPHNERSKLAIANMVKLSREMNIQLVAEGVETKEQLGLLQSLNCPVAQGYIFSAPLSGGNFLKWLKQYDRQKTFRKTTDC